MKISALSVILTLLTGCAAKLERGGKKSGASPADIDLSKVHFYTALDDDEVTVLDYMQEESLDYLLLMFGSVGCAKCNEKAKGLSADYLGKHSLFLEGGAPNFALIGVNTDTGTNEKRFKGIMLNEETRSAWGYDFIKWRDPSGKAMREHLLGDAPFGVPFTVMLSRNEIKWIYTNQQSYTLDSLMEKIEKTLAGEDVDTGGDGNGNKGGDKGEVTSDLLAFEGPKRFGGVRVEYADGSVGSLGSKFGASDYTFFQVDRGNCSKNGTCWKNRRRFDQIGEACVPGKTCGFFTLAGKRPQPVIQQEETIGQGGDNFFDVFRDHFNWNYTPDVDEWGSPSSLPAVDGPLTLGFDRQGKLIYSHEGTLPRSHFRNSIEKVLAAGAQQRSMGMDVPIFGPAKFGENVQQQSFADLRQHSKLTIVAAFDRYCGSCIEELVHWSQPGQLGEYCSNRPGLCQVFGLEAELAPNNTPGGRNDFYEEIKGDFLDPRGVKIPLLIDVEEFTGGYSRLFEAYLTPAFPAWEGVYGTVIYDQEGKILASFKSSGAHDPDPVLQAVKKFKRQL